MNSKEIKQQIAWALQEDIGSGDVTAQLLPAGKIIHATIFSREAMLCCGQAWVNQVFESVDPQIHIEWLVKEGDWLDQARVLCRLRGEVRSILTAERTALNFLQTLSGTATQTYHYLQILKEYPTRLLDTRKTIPGLRMAQKYAVACAGGTNHRLGLYDAFLIKENHITACGSISAAIKQARAVNPELFLEVEVETLTELQQALQGLPDRILLDNFTLEAIQSAVSMRGKTAVELEVSGGVNISTIRAIAATGVDYISVGSITKSVQAIDLSLLIDNHSWPNP